MNDSLLIHDDDGPDVHTCSMESKGIAPPMGINNSVDRGSS